MGWVDLRFLNPEPIPEADHDSVANDPAIPTAIRPDEVDSGLIAVA